MHQILVIFKRGACLKFELHFTQVRYWF